MSTFFQKKTAEDYLDAIITENGRNTKKSARKAILTGFLGHLSLVAASLRTDGVRRHPEVRSGPVHPIGRRCGPWAARPS